VGWKKNGEHLPNIRDLSGDQLELLRKALKVDRNIASGLLKKWLGGGGNEGKQEVEFKRP